jgi:hypothetical protein
MSINELFKQFQLDTIVKESNRLQKQESVGIQNPDIYGDNSAMIKRGDLKTVYDLNPQDRYMNNSTVKKKALSKKTEQVNGNWQRLRPGKSTIDSNEYLLEGDIQPNARISRSQLKSLNPLSAPYDYINGSEKYYLRIPKDALYANNGVSLINEARMSYASMAFSYGNTPDSDTIKPSAYETSLSAQKVKDYNKAIQEEKNKAYDDFAETFDLPGGLD